MCVLERKKQKLVDMVMLDMSTRLQMDFRWSMLTWLVMDAINHLYFHKILKT
jgi:hypothetical protein